MDTPILNLPEELLDLILGYITDFNDRLRLALVCKQFQEIARRQLRPHCRMNYCLEAVSATSNSVHFPFSEVFRDERIIRDGESLVKTIRQFESYWDKYGDAIEEIALSFNFHRPIYMKDMIEDLHSYFPNLKRLSIKLENTIRNKVELNSDISDFQLQLPIRELNVSCMHSDYLKDVLYLLKCCPNLKKLQLFVSEHFIQHLMPWIEQTPNVQIQSIYIPLSTLRSLPETIHLSMMQFSYSETLENIREYFRTKRNITELMVPNYHNANALTIEMLSAISVGISVKKVRLRHGIPDFPGSLDTIAQLPGIENISIECTQKEHAQNIGRYYPKYWTYSESAAKIKTFWTRGLPASLENVPDFINLTDLQIGGVIFKRDESDFPLTDCDLQIIIQNCPKLTRLWIHTSNITNDGLLGKGLSVHWKPISALENLENLGFGPSPNITSAGFKEFNFQKLKKFEILEAKISNIGAALLACNCPNLKIIKIGSSTIDDEGLEFMIRELAKLRRITFCDHKGSIQKAEQLRKEFSHMYIGFQ